MMVVNRQGGDAAASVVSVGIQEDMDVTWKVSKLIVKLGEA